MNDEKQGRLAGLRHEPVSRSLPMYYILESTFARIFLFLELALQQGTHIYINLHSFAQCTICMHCFCYIFLSSFGNIFILIGHSKQCMQSRRTRGVLKIEKYTRKG